MKKKSYEISFSWHFTPRLDDHECIDGTAIIRETSKKKARSRFETIIGISEKYITSMNQVPDNYF